MGTGVPVGGHHQFEVHSKIKELLDCMGRELRSANIVLYNGPENVPEGAEIANYRTLTAALKKYRISDAQPWVHLQCETQRSLGSCFKAERGRDVALASQPYVCFPCVLWMEANGINMASLRREEANGRACQCCKAKPQ